MTRLRNLYKTLIRQQHKKNCHYRRSKGRPEPRSPAAGLTFGLLNNGFLRWDRQHGLAVVNKRRFRSHIYRALIATKEVLLESILLIGHKLAQEVSLDHHLSHGFVVVHFSVLPLLFESVLFE